MPDERFDWDHTQLRYTEPGYPRLFRLKSTIRIFRAVSTATMPNGNASLNVAPTLSSF
jgi:hypothetical protein